MRLYRSWRNRLISKQDNTGCSSLFMNTQTSFYKRVEWRQLPNARALAYYNRLAKKIVGLSRHYKSLLYTYTYMYTCLYIYIYILLRIYPRTRMGIFRDAKLMMAKRIPCICVQV